MRKQVGIVRMPRELLAEMLGLQASPCDIAIGLVMRLHDEAAKGTNRLRLVSGHKIVDWRHSFELHNIIELKIEGPTMPWVEDGDQIPMVLLPVELRPALRINLADCVERIPDVANFDDFQIPGDETGGRYVRYVEAQPEPEADEPHTVNFREFL